MQDTDSSFAMTFRSSRFELRGTAGLKMTQKQKTHLSKVIHQTKNEKYCLLGFFPPEWVYALTLDFQYVIILCEPPIFLSCLLIHLTCNSLHSINRSHLWCFLLPCGNSQTILKWTIRKWSFGNEAKIKGKGKYSWVPFFPLWNKADLNCTLPCSAFWTVNCVIGFQ